MWMMMLKTEQKGEAETKKWTGSEGEEDCEEHKEWN